MDAALKQANESDLWRLTFGQPQIDPDRLAGAIEREGSGQHDDSLAALKAHWGAPELDARLKRLANASRLSELLAEDLGPPGFVSIERRLVRSIDRNVVLQFLRELGGALHRQEQVFVGGSAALILAEKLRRQTNDVDFVDEVPTSLREEHVFRDSLEQRYGLQLAHFQSRYLPDDWKSPAASVGRFEQLDVFTVDPLGVFVGKLFSARAKDRDDLRILAPQFARREIQTRLAKAAQRLLADPKLKADAQRNWYIVFGDDLPA